jgi:hypothetical protein
VEAIDSERRMRVVVTAASRHGATHEIAEDLPGR